MALALRLPYREGAGVSSDAIEPRYEALGRVVLGALIQVPDTRQFTGSCRVPKWGFRSEDATISGLSVLLLLKSGLSSWIKEVGWRH